MDNNDCCIVFRNSWRYIDRDIKMTKLKTLKDLKEGHSCVAYEERVKKEAIKWVKYYLECNPKFYFTPWCKFFNITEKDLK